MHVGGYPSDDGGGHRGKSKWRVADESYSEKTQQKRLTRTFRRNLEMVVADPWRQSEDDPRMDGERLKSAVVVMDK